MAKRTGRKSRSRRTGAVHRRKGMLMTTAVLGLLCAVVLFGTLSLQAKSRSYQEQIDELEAEIAEEEARTAEIEEYKDYIETDEYVIEAAEEKLGLVDPDEIIFQPVQ